VKPETGGMDAALAFMCACARDKKFKALSVREFNTIKRLLRAALQHKHIQNRAEAPLCALLSLSFALALPRSLLKIEGERRA